MQKSQHNLDELMRELGMDSANTKLRKSLERVTTSKPDAPLSPQFKATLRTKIASEAEQQKLRHERYSSVSQDLSSNSNNSTTINFSIFMKRYIMPAVLAVFVFVAGGAWYANQNNPALFQDGKGNEILSGKFTVDELEENSFGDLAKVEIVDNGKGGNAGTGTEAGGMNAQADSEKLAAPQGGEGAPTILPPPYYDAYRFKYVGGDLPKVADSQPVYKRLKPETTESLAAKIIRIFSFGLIDLTKFSNTKLQSISFLEDKDYGYNVNVDLAYGNVSMYQNWERWPQPAYDCYSYDCPGPEPIKIGDVPSDEEVFSAVEQFIDNYSISREGYGKPEVVEYSNWRVLYDQSPDKDNFFIPDTIQVVYPMVLDGRKVMDESGNPTGMNITYNIRERKVVGMYDLMTKKFEKSRYEAETDKNRLLKVAENGGFRNYSYYEGAQNIATLELDTPTIQTYRIWYSADPMSQGEDLYVPVMVFPIKNWDQSLYWKQNIIVPIVKSILDTEDKNNPPYPMPMPVDLQDQPAVKTENESGTVQIQPVN